FLYCYDCQQKRLFQQPVQSQQIVAGGSQVSAEKLASANGTNEQTAPKSLGRQGQRSRETNPRHVKPTWISGKPVAVKGRRPSTVEAKCLRLQGQGHAWALRRSSLSSR